MEYNKARFKYEKLREITLSSLTHTNKSGGIDLTDKVTFLSPLPLFSVRLPFLSFQLCNYIEAHARHCESLAGKLSVIEPHVLRYRTAVHDEREQIHLRLEEERKQQLMKKQSQQQMLQQENTQGENGEGTQVKGTRIFGIAPHVVADRGDSTVDGIPRIIDKLFDFLELKGDALHSFLKFSYIIPMQRLLNWVYSGLQALLQL